AGVHRCSERAVGTIAARCRVGGWSRPTHHLCPMLVGRRILVAPLDWGLGHAARCVPIIRALLQRQAVPVIGADGGALALLRGEFPRLAHVRVPGVTVHYARGRDQLWTL